jgi:hypothetical protein
MNRQIGLFWLEAALASAFGLLFALTLIRRDWIEVAFGVDPDQRSGSLEALAVAGLLVLALALSGLAGRQWRRARNRQAN